METAIYFIDDIKLEVKKQKITLWKVSKPLPLSDISHTIGIQVYEKAKTAINIEYIGIEVI